MLEATTHLTRLTPNKARALLGRFLFSGEEAEKPLEVLSGGERRRLSLAILVQSGANVLILDEPTNHLDLESREALEQALGEFTGSLLLVSHDRALLDAVGERTVAIEDRDAAQLRRRLARVRARPRGAGAREAARPSRRASRRSRPEAARGREADEAEAAAAASPASRSGSSARSRRPRPRSARSRTSCPSRPPGRPRSGPPTRPPATSRPSARSTSCTSAGRRSRARAPPFGPPARHRRSSRTPSGPPGRPASSGRPPLRCQCDPDAAARSGTADRGSSARRACACTRDHRERLGLRWPSAHAVRLPPFGRFERHAVIADLEGRPVHLDAVHGCSSGRLLDLEAAAAADRVREVRHAVRAHAARERERLAARPGRPPRWRSVLRRVATAAGRQRESAATSS